jgi:hypothetical protein
MATIRGRLALLLLMTSVFLLGLVGPADAQEQLRFVFTPQVWLANIPHNGFAAAGGGGSFAGFGFSVDDLQKDGPDPTSILFPQWGGQFAVQWGRWTFGVAGQYISFEHRTDLRASPDAKGIFDGRPTGFPADVFSLPCGPLTVPCGDIVATEIIRTDRVDIDLTATYFFPDVVAGLLDVNAGAGFKWVRTSGHRQFVDNESFLALDYCLKGQDIRAQNTPGNEVCTLVNKASFLDNIYAVTFPTTLNFHLSRDGKWLLPFTATPLVGWQERTDQVFGYSSSIAYGGSLDAGIRYVFDNGIALYAGYRGQAIIGINRQVAHGPLFNMSVVFGGK